LIYYCVDDLALSSAGARRVEPSEQAFFEESDLVFVTSAQLQRKALAARREAHLFPAGVDYETLARVRDTDQPRPQDLMGVSKPIVGYSGGRPPWVDLSLIAQAARELPQASFVLVGPPTDVPELRGISNVFSLGPKSTDVLPAYLRAFDVALVPYALTAYTAAIFPAKLYEYFVFGMPVVSTPLQEIVALCREHGPVVRTAPPEEFVTAVGDAIRDGARDTLTPARQALAKANDWTGRIEAMSLLIDRALAARQQ
jgi:glycosyltransferase involved in cell wall biosynthesis